ncbi:MAG: low temperature requirement protein A [Alphaproteobacteria bacterium]|nr:low temperature requirement protein A [Alphaproteobacteria bacterium]
MRNRWFHRPVLHTELDRSKRASWLELFFDLIVVAATLQLGNALSHGVAHGHGLEAFALFALHFVPLWVGWTGFTFYANRFDVDDFVHRLLVFAQMFAVGGMAVTAHAAMDLKHPDPRGFSASFALTLGLVSLMYLRSIKHTEQARDYSRYWAVVFGAGALIWALSALVPAPASYAVWLVGLAVVIGAPLSRTSRALSDAYPLDQEHLSERYGLLTIIVLGESFVKVLTYLSEDVHGSDPESMLKGAFNLMITCAVWWVYFDDIAGSRIKAGPFRWVAWLYGHLPLTLFVTGVGVAVKYATQIDLWSHPTPAYRLLLAGTVAGTLLSVALIDSVTERRQAELSDAWRVRVRAGSAGVLLLVAAVGGQMSGWMYLALVALIAGAQVAIDMLMAPMEDTGEQPDGAASTAELARRRQRGETTDGPRRIDMSQTVRKGTPSELRSDLYFFLMEGSWSRMMAVLGAAGLVLNVVFAALFLLDDHAIGGAFDGSFASAFAFSVQTMATIGYGAMAPGDAYGDLIVTLEAAVGLLGVAVATGLIFAKLSRPQAKVLFSRKVVLTTWNGKPTLTFRVGNARGNEIVDATMTIAALCDDVSAEGHHLRRLVDLQLVRSRQPMFRLSWTVQHVIDETSPLKDIDWSNPEAGFGALIVSLLGHDATYASTTHARYLYYPEDVAVGHRFVDVMSQLPDGRLMIDYDLFHDTEPDAVAMARDAEHATPA